MRNRHIEQLNKRLGEALGLVGNEPRFSWKWSADINYYTKAGEAYERVCWAGRIGKCWLLCQYQGQPTSMDPNTGQASPITKEQWWRSFRGFIPYPEKVYKAHPETALIPGLEPSSELNAAYIVSLRRQIEMGFWQHLKEGEEELQKAREENQKEFFEEVDNWFPYGWKNGQAHEPGTRGAHISFGGI